eukprot:g806.t1
MCFANEGHGKLTVGGIDNTLYTGSMTWTPLVFDISLSVAVKGMSVGGTSVKMDATEAVLDSGTTALLLPGNLYSALQSSFSSVPGASDLFAGKCAPVDASEWPTITMQLDGIALNLAPEHYLVPEEGAAEGTYCLGILNTGRGLESMFIIGDTIMSQYYIVYDRKASRVGWATASTECFQ